MPANRRAVLLVLGLLLCACDDAPTGPTVAPSITGNWQGLLGQSMSGTALRMTWQASRTGDSVAGPATIFKPSLSVVGSGTLEGTLTGNQLTLRLSVPTGNVPGFPACAVTGTGSATVSGNSLSGTLATNFSSCTGTGLEPPTSNQLSMTRTQ